MTQGFFIGAVLAVVVMLFMGVASLIKEGSSQAERTEQTFRAECAAVNGRAVWNNKYWECLK